MRERPILFSGPMVRALLAGRKSQTRRVIVPQPVLHADSPLVVDDGAFFGMAPDGSTVIVRHRFGNPGDRLWVRESVRRIGDDWVEYAADGSLHPDANWPLERPSLPSIFMPRALCRIRLEVEAVRVERLQEISEGDIIAEGCPNEYLLGRNWWIPAWDSINGKRGFSWASNPWVWVVTFRRVSGDAT